MRGKYSPTVTLAYMKDQKWFDKYVGDDFYDPEGYDAYGYDRNDMDRAGYYEYEYIADDEDLEDYNSKYEDALYRTSFDGIKPVVKR